MRRLLNRVLPALTLIILFAWSGAGLAGKPTRDLPSSSQGTCMSLTQQCDSNTYFFADAPASYLPIVLSNGGVTATVKLSRLGSFAYTNPFAPSSGTVSSAGGGTVISIIPSAAAGTTNIGSESLVAVSITPTVAGGTSLPTYSVSHTSAPIGYFSPTQGGSLVAAPTPVSMADGSNLLWTFAPGTARTAALGLTGFPDNTAPSIVSEPSGNLPNPTTVVDGGNGLANLGAANIAIIVQVTYTDGTPTKNVVLGSGSLAGGIAPCPSAATGVVCHTPGQPANVPSLPFNEITRLDDVTPPSAELQYAAGGSVTPTCTTSTQAGVAGFQQSGAAGLARALTYQYVSPVNQTVTIDSSGSHLDTVLLVSSPDDPAYKTPLCNDDQASAVQALLPSVPMLAGKTYNIAVGEFPRYTYYPCVGYTSSGALCSQTVLPSPLNADPVVEISIKTATATTVSCSPQTLRSSSIVTCNATVTNPTAPATVPTGTVTFTFNSSTGNMPLATVSAPLSGSVASATIAVPGSTAYVVASYTPSDPQFAASSSAPFALNVSYNTSSLTLTPQPAAQVYGYYNAYVLATVVDTSGTLMPTGTVTFTISNQGGYSTYTYPVGSNGTASTPVELSTGTGQLFPQYGVFSVSATYSGDSNTNAATAGPLLITISPPIVTTTVSSVSATAVPAGSTLTVTSSVGPTTAAKNLPTLSGNLILFDGSTQVGASVPVSSTGAATFAVTGVTAGTHSYFVQYDGNSFNEYMPSASAAQQVIVSKDASATTLMVSATPVTLNTPVTLTATVANASGTSLSPSGMVTFYNGSAMLGSGTITGGIATLTTSAASVNPGTQQLTAQYAGDTNFSISVSTPVPLVITTTTPTTTTLSASSATAVAGGSVTLTGAINKGAGTATPTGTLTYFDGGVALGSSLPLTGSTVYTATNLTVGTHNFTAVYSGDTNYATSTSTPATPVIVSKAASSVSLTGPTASVVVNGSATFTATLTNASGTSLIPGGSVVFYNGSTMLGSATLSGGTALSGSTASLTTAAASVTGGVQNITAQYSGDTNFNTATSKPLQLTVLYAAAVSESISSTTAVAGAGITVTSGVAQAGGAPVPTGTLTLLDGGSAVGSPVPLTAAPVVFPVSNLALGAHNYTVMYSGDTAYAAATSMPTAVTVTKDASAVTLSSAAGSVALNAPILLSAVVTNSSGTTLTPGGSVTFLNGSAVLGISSISNGVATLSTTALSGTAGTYTLTAQYGGDGNFTMSTSNSTQVVVLPLVPTATTIVPSSATPLAGASYTLTATVAHGSGTASPTGTLTLFDAGVQVGVPLAASAGSALFTIASATAGTHTYTVQYSGDAVYAGSTSTAAQVVVGKDLSTLALTASSAAVNLNATVTLTARAVNGSGTSLSPTGSVTFFSNGSSLGSAPLVNGAATLSTAQFTAAAGPYALTAQYAGDSSFNASTPATASITVIAPDYTLKAEQATLSLKEGQTGTSTIDLIAVGGFVQPVTFACAGLPVNTFCSFSPASLTADPAGDPISSTLTIKTATTMAGLRAQPIFPPAVPAVSCLAVGGLLLGCGLRRRNLRRLRVLSAGLALTLLSLAMSACGGGNISLPLTPPGTYNIQVNASASGGSARSTTVQITVSN